MELHFLNKLETAIFKKFNPDHESKTGTTLCTAFIASVVFCLIIFVCQMCNVSETTLDIIACIGLTGIFGYVIYLSVDNIKAFKGIGGKILFILYLVALTGITFQLSMWATMLVLAGLLIFGIFKIFFAPKKTGVIRYSDGSEEEADVETGICGEKTYTGRDSGRTFTE